MSSVRTLGRARVKLELVLVPVLGFVLAASGCPDDRVPEPIPTAPRPPAAPVAPPQTARRTFPPAATDPVVDSVAGVLPPQPTTGTITPPRDLVPSGRPTPSAWFGSVVLDEDDEAYVLAPSGLTSAGFGAAREIEMCGDPVGQTRHCAGLGRAAPELRTVATLDAHGVRCDARVVWQEDMLVRDTSSDGYYEYTTRAYGLRGCASPEFGMRGADEIVGWPDQSAMRPVPALARRMAASSPRCAPVGVSVSGLGTLATCSGTPGDDFEAIVATPSEVHTYVQAYGVVRFGSEWYVAYEVYDGTAMEPL